MTEPNILKQSMFSALLAHGQRPPARLEPDRLDLNRLNTVFMTTTLNMEQADLWVGSI